MSICEGFEEEEIFNIQVLRIENLSNISHE